MLQRTSVTATSALLTWGLCLAICCMAGTSAVACMPATERGILFEHVPTDIDAPVIIEATIYDSSQVGDAAGHQMVVMNARVDRVIKGSIDAKTLKIFVYLGGCTRVASDRASFSESFETILSAGLCYKPLKEPACGIGRKNSRKDKMTSWKP
jgi:hypothetical protein